jgi:hypothetical protein
MVIVDHRSQDGSRNILEKLKSEGLPLDIRHDERFAHLQSEVVTRLAHEINEQEHPDWIFPLDGDEFLIPTDGDDVIESLAREDPSQVLALPWRGYVLMPADNENEPHILKRMTYRRKLEKPQWWKVALPQAILKSDKDFKIPLGSHEILNEKMEPFPIKRSSRLALAHFPVRSLAQLLVKVVGGWLSHRLDPAMRDVRGTCFQWKAIYDELREGRSLTREDLLRLSLAYATAEQWNPLPVAGSALNKNEWNPTAIIHDPLPTDGVLKYPRSSIDAWQVLLKSAEDLADQYVRLALKSSKQPEKT